MPETNDLLRAARKRIESPSTPGAPMTRKELADLVNEHAYRTSNKITAVDANHVGKWERGVVRWPAAHYRAALRDILGADTDAALGFRRPRRGRSEDVDRKTFIKALGGSVAGALVARQAPGEFAHADELVATVAGPIEHYRRMESSMPTPDLTPAVEEHLTLATKVVTGPLRTTRGYAALSEIAACPRGWPPTDAMPPQPVDATSKASTMPKRPKTRCWWPT
ncbi:hypothetical protein GCM10011581_12360 [Saccharopolyspora subtropica]|uniref:Uncharacterized protein n=2 Tax=Saccharopolyspora thermophila TaxID=89367 RepID=A0A917JPE5_9PSEU|nr:hypothetical protein GCM10011581_12360 [Saccharopolyspora subtropica]